MAAHTEENRVPYTTLIHNVSLFYLQIKKRVHQHDRNSRSIYLLTLFFKFFVCDIVQN